jgi:hypothetical protein
MYDVGDSAHLTIEVRDVNGALADSTVALNITLPDQTTVGPFTPSHPSLGEYFYDYPTVQAGRHVEHWSGTGATVFAHTDVFDVEPSASIAIVSLASIKTQLAKKPTSTADDDELRGYLLSASENIETACGPCAVRSFTERVYGNNSYALFLTSTPVVSLTSFTPVDSWTPALAVADVTVNLNSGKVSRLFRGWPFIGDYDVTYTAGRPVVPSSLRTACQIIVQHLWETRRGVVGVAQGGDETVTLPGWGYAIPNRAAELIGGFREMMFVA